MISLDPQSHAFVSAAMQSPSAAEAVAGGPARLAEQAMEEEQVGFGGGGGRHLCAVGGRALTKWR